MSENLPNATEKTAARAENTCLPLVATSVYPEVDAPEVYDDSDLLPLEVSDIDDDTYDGLN
ncbi:hypothetical protein P3342_012419 [Pyrenophora teres f. teres]|nr:hypothetical protein P3342_012419 [Pyrenophora teres f. teres]